MPHESDAQASGSSRSPVRRWDLLDAETIERLESLAESRLGTTLAHRFKLDRIIAIGGMATVYEATQSPLMRRVAVKVLHPTEIEAGRTDFFLRVANAASNLRHPNIISIVDFGHEEDGTLFLAMEYVPGEDLGELLAREKRLEINRLVRISEQVCLALEVAHRAGVVHCDVKPSNVMIESMPGNPDFVKVVDFGISRVADERSDATPDDPEDEESAEENPIMGSFSFMAPEQLLERPIVPQTDIYSLGVMMYVALAGQLPYEADGDQELLYAILNTPPRDPREVSDQDIPDALVSIINRALAKTPGERYGSAAAMRRELMGLSRRQPEQEIDELSSFEILFPEDELLEEEVEEPVAMDDIDSQWDTYSDVVSLSTLNLREPERSPTSRAVELMQVDTDFSRESLNQFVGRPGRPHLVGRQEQLAQLWQAVQRTRRGGLAIWVSGAYGSGRSFFITRALKLVAHETNAFVMRCSLDAGDRERPYHALYQWLRAALSELHNRAGESEGHSELLDILMSEEELGQKQVEPKSLDLPKPATRNDDEDAIFTSASSQPDAGLVLPFPTPPPIPVHRTQEGYHRLDLLTLGMAKLETSILEALISRWDKEYDGTAPWDSEHRPFDGGPLRFPETRRHLLRFAFDAFLRRLSAVVQDMHPNQTERVPIVLAVDGWEHIDGPTHRIIRQVLQEGRNLPMLFLLSHNVDTSRLSDDFPEDDPTGSRSSADQPPEWCDLEIRMPSFNPDEISEFISLELGAQPNQEFIGLL
ncbi:MAG: BREX system ATP-binding domain-containing protein, partial [Myxococcota bacterium]